MFQVGCLMFQVGCLMFQVVHVVQRMVFRFGVLFNVIVQQIHNTQFGA